MRKSKLSPISLKRRKQIEEEYPIRIALCCRAGGTWIQTSKFGGHCNGGVCELCGKAGGHTSFDRLYPHEGLFRSKGGRVSLENSVMCHTWCNDREHHEKVIAPDEEK